MNRRSPRNIHHELRFTLFACVLQCNGCIRNCGHPSVKCFVIDNNGYIVLSKEEEDIGVFFGEIEGSVMHKLMEQKVFKNMSIYDFQAMCKIEENDNSTSDGNVLLTVRTFFFIYKRYLQTNFQKKSFPIFAAMECGNESYEMDVGRGIFLFGKIKNMDRCLLLYVQYFVRLFVIYFQ